MYPFVLALHSALRWVVLLAAVMVVVRACRSTSAEWTSADDRAIQWFSIAFNLQVLVGLVLFLWLSPIPRGALHDLSAAMRAPQLRFWIVEHPFGMVVAIALTHIGRARIQRTPDRARKRRLLRTFFGLAIVLILASIPWPGLPYGRPWGRMA
jgi:hypothetical protein